ncbi:response regulator [Polaribacter reichenbachii]|uniref:histidine kinase n=1 Tax=Polaribacter reichenbachii TaxID=996801 RepID=A0A1B8TQ76_9FLAO|nr:response regulator [Polaribacter reichenbachii]OBY61799.1 two-component system sensor histidine kinase/response regulator [Polaribacter reichenbachii]
MRKKYSQRRLNLLFTLALIHVGLSLLTVFIAHNLGFTWLRNYNIFNIFIYVIAATIVKKGLLNYARVIYLLASNFGIAVIASYVGKFGSVEFIYMFNIGLPFILFSFRRERLLVLLFTIVPLILWTLLFITEFSLFTDRKLDPVIAKEFIYPISVASAIGLVIFQLIYFLILNTKYFNRIENKKIEAIEASNAKSDFLSTMSHEIRTPLNAVIGLSHILGDDNPREDQVQNIEALNYSGKILLNLLNNVLDFSKMQSTTIELDNIPTNLLIATKQIKKIHEASCLRKGITMNLEVDEDIPVVWLDVVRFNQVINNLVTNAIKFTDVGSVTLRIKKVNQIGKSKLTLLTEIIDTGIGIPKDKQGTIWEAFTQASTNTNRLYGGTGLGLPIVKSIVNTMGSDVMIDSEMGKGSRFYFEIDLEIASEKELKKTIRKKKYNFEGKKVLLVEDNLINVMVGKQILEKSKLTVDVANDGAVAVTKIKENDYDVVLMDIQMPVMDGYTATKEIRKFNKRIPILALSASVFMEVKDKISECGMNGFIFKPFDPQDLLDQIEAAIKK